MSKLLEIKNLYGGYEEGVNILQGINLTVTEGEAVGIIGLNGSGKSTLGKAIMNQIPYRQGSIIFDGQPVDDKTSQELAQQGIALMLQGGVVFPNLSVWQNLQLALAGHKLRQKIQDSILSEIIPLLKEPKKKLMRTMADKLSGGQRHELALAMTLVRQPRLVILDEPSAGLSPKAVVEMYGMLEEIRKTSGITILLIEQNVMRAVDFCRRCVMMGQGMIVEEYTNKKISEIENTLFNQKC